MTKIWNEAFWKPHPGTETPARFRRVQCLPVVALALLTVLIGIFADPIHRLALDAAAALTAETP